MKIDRERWRRRKRNMKIERERKRWRRRKKDMKIERERDGEEGKGTRR